MNHLVRLSILPFAISCSAGPGSTPAAGTNPSPKPTVTDTAADQSPTPPKAKQNVGGVGVGYCKLKRPFQSWGDNESHFAFCERFASRAATCDHGTGGVEIGICNLIDNIADRETEIIAECMTQQIDLAKVPEMIKTVQICECGPQWADTGVCSGTIKCHEKLACLRAAGFVWSPPARAQAKQAESVGPDWSISSAHREPWARTGRGEPNSDKETQQKKPVRPDWSMSSTHRAPWARNVRQSPKSPAEKKEGDAPK